MALPWVQGRIVGRMEDGRITARVVERRQMEDRPRSFEQSGASREVYERLNRREEGFEFETFGFMGGAVAWVLPTQNVELLPERWIERLERQNRGPLAETMYVALIRNAGAPTIQFCAEPAGGMPDDPEVDWLYDLLDEGLELGVYNEDGWLGFKLPLAYARYQGQLDQSQNAWWTAVNPGLSRIGYADVSFLPVGTDALDGECGIIVPCFTAGEFSFLKVATLRLEGEWKLADLECRRTPEGWQALKRKVVGITPREGMSPMLWQFSPEGGLDHCGPHFPLSGETVPAVLSHLSIPLLGPLGLDWLRG